MNFEIDPLEVRKPLGFGVAAMSNSLATHCSAGAPAAQVGGSVMGRYTRPATGMPARSENPMQTLHCSPSPDITKKKLRWIYIS